MALRLPRLLPLTIVAMAALLGVKSVALVRAAAPATASNPASTAAPALAAGPASPTPPQAASPGLPPPAGMPSPAEQRLLQDLARRSAALDARAAALALKETVLQAAEKRVAAEVAELQALQKKLAAEDQARQAGSEANWDGLVKLYQNMRPQDAATIFNGLDMHVLLEVVRRMNERKAAPILAAMDPEKARALTAQLAAAPGGSGSGQGGSGS
jgi:flagellar motility protein MotE (MotC chaperone)